MTTYSCNGYERIVENGATSYRCSTCANFFVPSYSGIHSHILHHHPEILQEKDPSLIVHGTDEDEPVYFDTDPEKIMPTKWLAEFRCNPSQTHDTEKEEASKDELIQLRDDKSRRDEEDRRREDQETAELKAQILQCQQLLSQQQQQSCMETCNLQTCKPATAKQNCNQAPLPLPQVNTTSDDSRKMQQNTEMLKTLGELEETFRNKTKIKQRLF